MPRILSGKTPAQPHPQARVARMTGMHNNHRMSVAVACLLLGACASLPPATVREDMAGFRNVREQAHYRVSVREGTAPLPAGARFHLPVARVQEGAAGPTISEAQAAVVATHAARSVCLVLSPWVRWVEDDAEAGRIALDLRRIGPSNGGLAATSAVIDAVVPGPFRLPAGLGALEIDSRVEAVDGSPLLELRWARGANPVLHRARASSIGDAWELAPSNARDLKAALAALHPAAQTDDVRKANLAACTARFGEVSVAGRAASLFLPLSPEALDPSDDEDPSP